MSSSTLSPSASNRWMISSTWSRPRVSRCMTISTSATEMSAKARRCPISSTLAPHSATIAVSRASSPGRSLTFTIRCASRPSPTRPRSMMRSMMLTSMLPPDRTITVTSFGEGDGAGALGDDLLALDQQIDRGRDLALADGDDVVHVPLDQRERPLADPLDRDAVRDGLRRLDVDDAVRLPGEQGGGGGLCFDADHADVRAALLERYGHAADQPAAADRHDDARQVRDLFQQLEPDGALAGNDEVVIEGVHHGE